MQMNDPLDDEIQEVTLSIRPEKAPGLDGFTTGFFSSIGKLVCLCPKPSYFRQCPYHPRDPPLFEDLRGTEEGSHGG